MIKKEILHLLQKATKKLGIDPADVILEHPMNSEFGDYTTNVALRASKKLKKNPIDLATSIIGTIPSNPIIKKAEVVKPGFINIWINEPKLIEETLQIANSTIDIDPCLFGKSNKIVIEFAHPNTHKLFHIGHLRNITTGESLARILQAAGNKVVRVNYQGDVGLHIAKCVWQLQRTLQNDDDTTFKDKKLSEKIGLLGKAYAEGNKAYETDEIAKKEIIEINRKIYQEDPSVIDLWQETRKWSLDYFQKIYLRVYTHFDHLYFESEQSKRALEIVSAAIKKGILEKSKGAIIFNGEKYGLHTRVFVNSIGIATYEGKDLGLAEKEFGDYGEIDKCMHIVGPEQSEYFKVVFKVQELLDPDKYKDKQMHLVYGWVKLKHGKMSSRSGNVVEGEWLIDETKKKILEKFKSSEETAETLAVAAVKYSFLKNSVKNETVFDFDESISLEGNSAAYLMYTFVRASSILRQNKTPILKPEEMNLRSEELDLLRFVRQYPDIVHTSAKTLSPNVISTYLFTLAHNYNFFYQKLPILKAPEDSRALRLLLTQSVQTILKNGLYLLGIETVEKM
ncbi:MAG: arginine--tRNA ligase [bacterium]|nr:arginine--tRNA ligase [bacterium]